MLDYRWVKRDRWKFLALTGLTLKEFKALLPAFVDAYRGQYPPEKTVAGRKRQRQRATGKACDCRTAIVVHPGVSKDLSAPSRARGIIWPESIGGESVGPSSFACVARCLERPGGHAGTRGSQVCSSRAAQEGTSGLHHRWHRTAPATTAKA